MFLKKEFEEDKKITKKITYPFEHRSYRDKWLAFKQILDIIFNDPNLQNNCKIIINKNYLTNIQTNWLEYFLKKIKEMKIVTTMNNSQKIIINDVTKFKKFRMEVSNYYFYFQNEGEKKHPNVYIKNKSRLIDKNSQGDYFYKGKLIEMPKNTLYYNIFDIVYSKGDQENFISYENITKELIKRKIWMDSDKKRNADILNNFNSKNQGLFKYAKVSGNIINNTAEEGHKLIEVKRGEGLKLNNPFI